MLLENSLFLGISIDYNQYYIIILWQVWFHGQKVKMRRTPLFLIGLLLAFVFPVSVGGQDKLVTAKGLANLLGNDIVLARDQAIQNALRKVVEQAVGTFVSAETQVEDFEFVRDQIFTRSSGFIKNYAIVSESLSKELGAYTVTLEARVSVGQLNQEVDALLTPSEKGVLITQQGQPRIMVQVNERFIGNQMSGQSNLPIPSRVEQLLMDELRKKGFQFIQPSIHSQGQSQHGILRQDMNSHQEADILIVGEVVATSGGAIQGTIMKPIHASLFLRAIHRDSGKFICEMSGQKTVPHISAIAGASEAVNLVSESLVPRFANLVFSKVAQYTQLPKMVHLTINVKDFLELLQFESSLRREIKGIQNLFRRSYNAKVGKVDVLFKGDVISLANELSSPPPNSSLAVEVLETSRNQLVLKTVH